MTLPDTEIQEMEEKARAAMQADRAAKYEGGLVGADVRQFSNPRSTLENALDSVCNGMDEAAGALERLSERMGLVLQPEYPQPANGVMAGAAPPEPLRSVTVCRLHAMRSQLDGLVCRINALSSRLD